jgi:branched-chain amino acid aminotransferase
MPVEIKDPHLPFAFFQGEFVPTQDANINIMTHGLQYGIGCFGGIRGYWNEEQETLYVFRLRDHFQRLIDSCRILQMKLRYGLDELTGHVLELAQRNGFRGDSYFRPFVYSSVHRLTPRLHDVEHEYALYSIPLKDYIDTTRGLKVVVSSRRRVDDDVMPTRAKASGAYLNSALAKSEAIQHGADEALLLNRDGHISEGSAENFFMIRNGVLHTTSITDNILEGITRRTLLQLAAEELGLKTVEPSIGRTEVYVADEVFLCGTGAQVAWVQQVDGRPIGDGRIGPITARLKSLYLDIVRGKVEGYRDWLTSIALSRTAALR